MNTPRHPKRPASGFTLVELLVVIAIIMVLLLLMMVPLQGIRDRAYTIQCAANLRSIGIAANLYAAEHNDAFPYAENWASAGPAWGDWAKSDSLPKGTLFPYLGSTRKAFLCPIFVRTFKTNPDLAHLTAYMNYTMNHYFKQVGWNCNGRQAWFVAKKALISAPSQLGLFTEENPFLTKYNNYIMNDLCTGVGYYGDPNSVIDGIASYHSPIRGDLADGYGNVCF